MNCSIIRNRILAVERPGHWPDDLSAHIDTCEACRAWAQSFVLMDEALSTLPLPAATGTGKTAVLEKIRTPKPQSRSPLSSANHKPLPAPVSETRPKRSVRFGAFAAKYWPAGLVAATLLIGASAWMNLRSEKPRVAEAQPTDPLLDSVVQINVDLVKTQSPAERVEALARLADELNQEMRDIARADPTGENMQALESMYRRVVLTALVSQAKQIERSQRERVLVKVADRLAQAKIVSDQTAEEAPEHSRVRLREAAATAAQGKKEIENLIRKAAL